MLREFPLNKGGRRLFLSLPVIAGDRVFSLILGRSSLRGFCLFISYYLFDYRQKNPLKYSIAVSHSFQPHCNLLRKIPQRVIARAENHIMVPFL